MTSPSPDLANMTQAADFWHMSMNETEAWEDMRVECHNEERMRLTYGEAVFARVLALRTSRASNPH